MTDTIIKTVILKARPEVVWSYLVEKDKIAQWFNGPTEDLHVGEAYEALHEQDGKMVPKMWGRVLSAEKPVRLVYTMQIGPFGDAETTITFELNPVAGGTRLQVTHEGIAEASGEMALGMLTGLDHGWDVHLQSLREVTGA